MSYVETSNVTYGYESVDEAFPEVDCGHNAFGEFVIVQIRVPKTRTRAGLEIPDSVRDTEHYNTQVARVLSVGDRAFQNRLTGEKWDGGPWYKPGDYVRCPKYGGDRWSKTITRARPEAKLTSGFIMQEAGEEKVEVVFALFRETDIRSGIASIEDALSIKAFI